MERIIALWFPDYPILAARAEIDSPHSGPLALVNHSGIYACDAAARSAGVRRGMKRRQAQSLCPEMHIMAHDPDCDGKHFEEFIADIDSIAAGVEILRPGLVALKAKPLEKYYKTEANAISILLETLARPGIDTFAGVADTLPAAVLAARRGAIIPPGQTAEFLAGLPLRALKEEESLGNPAELVGALESMGITTISHWAALSSRAVGSRFGQEGLRWWKIARAQPERALYEKQSRPDLAVTHRPAQPLHRTDTIAFIGRKLAAQLHHKLLEHDLVCQRVAVRALIATPDGPIEKERTWRSTTQLSEHAIAERVRWQMDGWIHQYVSAQTPQEENIDEAPPDEIFDEDQLGLIELTLDPISITRSVTRGLWGATEEHAAQASIERVQTMLGPDKVLSPILKGGRGPADRIALVPYGETPEKLADPTHTWPGQLPAPLPATSGDDRGPGPSHPAAGIALYDDEGQSIMVTGRVALSSTPTTMKWGKKRYAITGWAGPWPVDEQWWHNGKRFARLQITTDEPCGLLLLCKGNQWRVEGIYK